MLVLTRKQNESLRIGGGIVVHVLEIRGGRVRLGIDADPSIDVRRFSGRCEVSGPVGSPCTAADDDIG